jgi:putative protease
MNAKDLMGIRQLPDIIRADIESVKIEGRMKSNLYAANASSVYRRAIDWVFETLTATPDTVFSESDSVGFENELSTVSNRTFSSGGLEHRPLGDSIAYDFDAYAKDVEFIGTITHIRDNKMFVEIKHEFSVKDTLQALTPDGKRHAFQPQTITTVLGEPLERVFPNTMIAMPVETFSETLGIFVKPLPTTVFSS